MIFALRVCSELAPQVVIGLVFGVLEVVFAVRGGLPDVDDSPCDRFLGDDIHHPSMHEGHLALVRVLYYAIAIVTEGGVGAPEGAQDCGGGRDLVGLDCVGVSNFVDQAARWLGGRSETEQEVESLLTILSQ